MSAKRKVFISSTVDELKNEREYLYNKIKTLSNDYLLYEPYLSEVPEAFHFTEKDLSTPNSVDICLKKVHECNYYVLMIKNDYNYNDELNCSVTELEYITAKELHKPIFVFVLESENRNEKATEFVKRVSNENWRFLVNDEKEIFKILRKILNEFDSSTFISEYPSDCIIVSKDTIFTKRWVIKNTGNQIWKKRYMKHIVPATNMIPFREEVAMPVILPDDEYIFEISYNVKKEGTTHSRWKMYNENNEECFPSDSYKGLWFDVVVKK